MDDRYQLAKAVESGVFQALSTAWEHRDNPQEADRWFRHADKLDTKFKNQYGMHYSTAIALVQAQ